MINKQKILPYCDFKVNWALCMEMGEKNWSETKTKRWKKVIFTKCEI